MSLRFVLLLFLALFAACEDATPPMPGPNNNVPPPSEAPPAPNEIPTEVTIAVSPTEVQIPSSFDVPDAPLEEGSDSTSQPSEEFTPPAPNATVSVSAGAFNPQNTVSIGVFLAADFSGIAPKVGPLDPDSADDIATTSTATAASDGSLQFGVYSVTAFTTPGTYILFASQNDNPHTITITLLPPESDL